MKTFNIPPIKTYDVLSNNPAKITNTIAGKIAIKPTSDINFNKSIPMNGKGILIMPAESSLYTKERKIIKHIIYITEKILPPLSQ
mgnify:CR=1 FL=1